jgi:hypothetical protein
MLVRILGVDPGITGALAVLAGDQLEGCWDIPIAGGEIDPDELLRIIRAAKADLAIIERASSRPGQGVSSTFRYGQAFGMLRMAVAVCAFPQHLVTPKRCRPIECLTSSLGCRPKRGLELKRIRLARPRDQAIKLRRLNRARLQHLDPLLQGDVPISLTNATRLTIWRPPPFMFRRLDNQSMTHPCGDNRSDHSPP